MTDFSSFSIPPPSNRQDFLTRLLLEHLQGVCDAPAFNAGGNVAAALRTIAAAAVAAALSGPAAAAGLPRFDIERACSADAAGTDTMSCLEAERSAKAYLDETWSTYSAAEGTAMCLRRMKSHRPPGYRKLLACLMTRGEPMEKTGGVPSTRDQTQAPPK